MYFTHSFEATISTYDFGAYFYTVVYVPAEVTDDLPMTGHPRLRIEGEVDHEPVEGSLMPDRVGSRQTSHLVGEIGAEGDRVWYLMTPKSLLSKIDKNLGDRVDVRLRMADQDAVTIPAALEDFLSGNGAVREVWETLTPGRKRGLAHQIASARTQPTIERRLAALADELLRSRGA